MKGQRRSIGANVYVVFDGFNLTLTTTDAARDTHTIVLDPASMLELQRVAQQSYAEAISELRAAERAIAPSPMDAIIFAPGTR